MCIQDITEYIDDIKMNHIRDKRGGSFIKLFPRDMDWHYCLQSNFYNEISYQMGHSSTTNLPKSENRPLTTGLYVLHNNDFSISPYITFVVIFTEIRNMLFISKDTIWCDNITHLCVPIRTLLSNRPRSTSECVYRIDDESIIVVNQYTKTIAVRGFHLILDGQIVIFRPHKYFTILRVKHKPKLNTILYRYLGLTLTVKIKPMATYFITVRFRVVWIPNNRARDYHRTR
ncbi:hypothetical protein AGLY_007449 [Aphis glycines]|uniref:Uncharacterized protein n=1 Tax=Aphis glycines TaxID=307491 RepID=A0A6G0TM78_APHGL|nr:hypothetical protein AGLY_007449 [Aphis glycines]